MFKKQAQIPIKLTAVRVRQLQLFALAAEVGSISEAARRSHVTQPAATEMLQELERAFSLQLYLRGAKGIVLTAQGERVAARAASALRELQWAVSEAASAKPVGEILRVGFVPPAIYGNLPGAVHNFVKANPDVLVNLKELTVPDAAMALMEGEVDVVVTVNHPSFTHVEGRERIQIHTLSVDYYQIFLSSTLELDPNWEPTPESMRQLSWILPVKESFTRGLLEDWFFRHGAAPPESFIEISPLTAAIEMLRTIPYAALLPSTLARGNNFPHLVQVSTEAFALPARLVIACKESQLGRPTVEAFVKEVVSLCNVPQ